MLIEQRVILYENHGKIQLLLSVFFNANSSIQRRHHDDVIVNIGSPRNCMAVF